MDEPEAQELRDEIARVNASLAAVREELARMRAGFDRLHYELHDRNDRAVYTDDCVLHLNSLDGLMLVPKDGAFDIVAVLVNKDEGGVVLQSGIRRSDSRMAVKHWARAIFGSTGRLSYAPPFRHATGLTELKMTEIND